MNAQAILDQIAADAQSRARQIADEAEQKAAAALEETRRKLADDEAAMRAQAEKDGAELTQRMGRMAELENRKALLEQKRTVIDEAFAHASERFAKQDAAATRAFFLRQIAQNAAGDERLIVGGANASWFDDRFLADANAALAKQGKPSALTLGDEKRPDATGFLLQKDGTEINCTLEAMLGDLRMDMETEVARQLFGEV